jgi:hypothetical protein
MSPYKNTWTQLARPLVFLGQEFTRGEASSSPYSPARCPRKERPGAVQFLSTFTAAGGLSECTVTEFGEFA